MARKNAVFNITGAREIERELKRLTKRAQGELIRDAAEAGAEVIREEAARRAPKDTGALKEGMLHAPRRLQIGRAAFSIGPDREEWYGALLERGTKHIPAFPWLRPAFDTTQEDAVEAARRVLRSGLIK